jgi:protein TonB
MFVSRLDPGLPNRPLEDWFRQIVGPQAGINWQLSECGESPGLLVAQGRDVPACVELNALLPDNRKVVVMIEVGTFKKGIAGNPAFSHAAVEQQGELFRLRRLIDLPDGLRQPATLVDRNAVKLTIQDSQKLYLAPELDEGKLLADVSSEAAPPPPGSKPPSNLVTKATPKAIAKPAGPTGPPIPALAPTTTPPTTASPKPASTAASPATPTVPTAITPKPGAPIETLKVSEGVWRDNAIVKAEPASPTGAKKSKLKGRVRVQVIVSIEGRVIEATAVSGPEPLRPAAVAAAFKWVFVPATLNGMPVQVESSLTFVFESDK